jgi:membrane protease YdiL (CAAX protease family)
LAALREFVRQAIAALTAVLPVSRFLTWSLGVSFGCVVVSIGIFFLRGKLDRPPSTIVMQLLPETLLEYGLFVALCLLIGLVEEFLFRGFAFLTLAGFLRSKMLAVAIVTVFFAVQHGIQDAIGVARAFVLGILLVIPVLVTGSLLPSSHRACNNRRIYRSLRSFAAQMLWRQPPR